jgi:hypothetical protein
MSMWMQITTQNVRTATSIKKRVWLFAKIQNQRRDPEGIMQSKHSQNPKDYLPV